MKRSMLHPGQGLVEYGLIILLVVLVALLVLSLSGVSLKDIYCFLAEKIGSRPVTCAASLFSDDFNDLSRWTVVSGKWEIKNGQLCTSQPGRIFVPIEDADNYVIQLNGAKLDQGNGYGIYFRADNFKAVNGYTFQYDPGLQGFAFREWYQGNEFSPSGLYRLPKTYDYYSAPHDIKVVVQGNSYTAFVDGQQVLSMSDSTYTKGGIGLRTWDATVVCFDSITVNRLP
ncbi:MAG: DUF1080 domain-containing protein [Anaerolineales bacterium]|nr:DUF1080 domain-containing protein [Anaerolineales bacterium]MCX7609849.1 DUF1080 domain-containing protein [Anaerolineales bacterium]MDW8227318.1 DUF1080 domain-containing protein [Anaerolineales bacterium]